MSLILSNITLSWPNKPILKDFSCEIAAGEIAVIQGPSGCGKSTLLHAIAGTSSEGLKMGGEITLDGKALLSLPAEQRHMGLLFQEALLFPHLNVAQNLGFGLPAALTRSERRARISQALSDADLTGYDAYDPAHLSGGQKARIALMRALLSEPKALLMDESFSALDPTLRSQFGQFVADAIHERQIPALLISHHEDDQRFATGPVIHWPENAV
ncbi:MAG: ATP-binding cassette domain-containing protein [Candidatus Puniceispirillaceae bacterium]